MPAKLCQSPAEIKKCNIQMDIDFFYVVNMK